MSEQIEARPGWRFHKVLLYPTAAMRQVTESPSFVKTALIITGLGLIMGIALTPKVQAFTTWMLTDGPAAIPPEQREQALAIAPQAAAVGAVVSAAVAPWLVWLSVAGLLKLYDVFAGAGVSFKSLFAVAVYGYLPIFIGGLITLPIALTVPVENLPNVSLSLAAFFPVELSFSYFLLAKCSPFTWWSLFLWGMGGALAMKSRPGSVVAYNFVWWLAYAMLAAALAAWQTPAGMGV
jgi:hypothetical protein